MSNSNANYEPKQAHAQSGANDTQDVEDEMRRKAIKDVVQSWMDRLQLISMITTFFASTEAGMLQVTTPSANTPSPASTRWANAANAAFQGALVMHVNAACISFLAAFVLIRYKVRAAKTEQKQTEQNGSVDHHNARASELEEAKDTESSYFVRFGGKPMSYLWSSNPHLVQVGPWRESKPPIHLLNRCHFLSVVLASIGFALCLIGILCFTWGWQPVSVSVFTSACMGLSLVACVSLLGTKKYETDDRLLYAHI